MLNGVNGEISIVPAPTQARAVVSSQVRKCQTILVYVSRRREYWNSSQYLFRMALSHLTDTLCARDRFPVERWILRHCCGQSQDMESEVRPS